MPGLLLGILNIAVNEGTFCHEVYKMFHNEHVTMGGGPEEVSLN